MGARTLTVERERQTWATAGFLLLSLIAPRAYSRALGRVTAPTRRRRALSTRRVRRRTTMMTMTRYVPPVDASSLQRCSCSTQARMFNGVSQGSLAQKAKMAEDARRKKEMADKIKAGKK